MLRVQMKIYLEKIDSLLRNEHIEVRVEISQLCSFLNDNYHQAPQVDDPGCSFILPVTSFDKI